VLSKWASVMIDPVANILGNDIFKTGILQSNTDFVAFDQNENFIGIDYAYSMNSHWYHSTQDSFDQLDPRGTALEVRHEKIY